jgi:16S rRNA U516 pseudouridylate synthase RsuA-like enzyme
MEEMKLQKYMSQAGICSRRKAEDYIARGLVKVDGETAHIGQVICPDKVTVTLEDKAVKEQKEMVYYKINKPRGIVTTCAEHGDTNVIDIVDIPYRVFPI